MEIEDLGCDEGLEGIKKATKIALIDADTIAYAACSGCEYADDILDESFYSQEEWAEIIADPNWDEEEHCIWRINIDEAVEACHERIADIRDATFTKSVELYFTSGKNFRHTVDPMYKANRKHTRYPVGLKEVKEILLESYPGCIGDQVEADDIVVYLKRTHPDKYVLCAVDKDVLRAVPGKHWNYYRSAKYGIDPKWVETTKEQAELFPYIQTLTGDSTDNIRGCPGIGPKKAIKALAGKETAYDRWDAVVKCFEQKNLTAKDAIRDRRLVDMHQVEPDGKGGYKWVPWTQPTQGV